MIKWENTGEILKRREHKKKGKREAPGIAVVTIADKPGLKDGGEYAQFHPESSEHLHPL